MLNNLITEHGLAEDGVHQLDYTHRKLAIIASMEGIDPLASAFALSCRVV